MESMLHIFYPKITIIKDENFMSRLFDKRVNHPISTGNFYFLGLIISTNFRDRKANDQRILTEK